jgi:para-aminobenzoate synthetase component 1
MKIIDLPYSENPAPVFANIADKPWSIWLDSGNYKNFAQRYDIFTSLPYKAYISSLNSTTIEHRKYNDKLELININNEKIKHDHNNSITPFDIIKIDLLKLNQSNTTSKNLKNPYQIPFWHGAIGYFGYDLNQLIFNKLQLNDSNTSMPLAAVGLYAWAVIYDHKLEKTFLAYDQDYIDNNYISNILETISSDTSIHNNNYRASNSTAIINDNIKSELTKVFKHCEFTTKVDIKTYKKNFDKIKYHIKHGNCYQINYTIPFELSVNKPETINNWQVYQYLKLLNQNPFGCYLKLDLNQTIMSFSPERFIKLKNNTVTSQPIKGTRPKVLDNEQKNNLIKQELANSIKDQAENIMITDLMRNDLNKICIPGSVQTNNICELHTFATVHHLISTVEGQLDSKYNPIDLLKSCFPGGSITGTPKLRAMQIIQTLENADNQIHRGIYCGNIGYINIDNTMDMNIAIRTIEADGNIYKYCAGGGIVADSDYKQEYQEIFNKLIKTSS